MKRIEPVLMAIVVACFGYGMYQLFEISLYVGNKAAERYSGRDVTSEAPFVSEVIETSTEAFKICTDAKAKACKEKTMKAGSPANLDVFSTVYLSKDGKRLFGKCEEKMTCFVYRMNSISGYDQEI